MDTLEFDEIGPCAGLVPSSWSLGRSNGLCRRSFRAAERDIEPRWPDFALESILQA